VTERKAKHVHITEDRGPWGSGLLSVLRTKGDKEQPYIGTVPLLTGHLAKDLTFYWFQSEQIPSAVGLGVYLNKGKLAAAAGFLVQALPGALDSEVKMIQNHIQNLSNLKQKILRQPDPVKLLAELFRDSAFTLVEEKELRFNCTCSIDRVEQSLALIGQAELTSILEEDGRAVVKCDFCSSEYTVEGPEIRKLISASSG
jgi:molecular chaperone Hsp33